MDQGKRWSHLLFELSEYFADVFKPYETFEFFDVAIGSWSSRGKKPKADLNQTIIRLYEVNAIYILTDWKKSQRMGEPRAWKCWMEKPMIEHMIEKCLKLAQKVAIVTHPLMYKTWS